MILSDILSDIVSHHLHGLFNPHGVLVPEGRGTLGSSLEHRENFKMNSKVLCLMVEYIHNVNGTVSNIKICI